MSFVLQRNVDSLAKVERLADMAWILGLVVGRSAARFSARAY
jgi:hypothetical protein